MKVSIVVAVYNTSKYLKQCLETVLNQDMERDEFEVIIVNDCSTDNSIDIINEMVAGYENVTVLDKKINEATFWSRVDGIKLAKGDYIGFVDSDDWCKKSMYRVMTDKAVKYNADIVDCGIIFEYADGSVETEKNRFDHVISAYDELSYYANHTMNYQYALFSRLYSRKVIDTFLKKGLPYFEENHNAYRGIRNEDDILFPLFIAYADNFCFIEDDLSHHREEIPDSTMDRLRKDSKKLINSCVYRVNAGFDVMNLTKDRTDIYKLIEHKQIDTMFGLLGKLLDYKDSGNDEAKNSLMDAIERFRLAKKNLPLRDEVRLIHLIIKSHFAL